MALSSTQKQIIVAASIVTVGVAGILVYNKIRKNRWSKGKKPKKYGEEGFNPNKEKMVAYVGEQGHANVRSSAEVKNPSMWSTSSWTTAISNMFSPPMTAAQEMMAKHSNLIGQVKSGKIGDVVSQQTGKDGFVWYEVKLAKKLKGKSTGYVRQDVARIKIEKK